MANEDKKDFNAMLYDNKDMPKFQIITDQKSIEKYGGNKMYFAPPVDYDKVMRKVPFGKVITVGEIRKHFAKLSGADFTEPITAGIFVSIVAWASYQRSEDETPYWRTLKANGELNINLKKEVTHEYSIMDSSRSYVYMCCDSDIFWNEKEKMIT
ncbi:alkylated DNA nucleotide flippase Atl1 [Clostridiales Family XIII bacterium PM5-7]